MSIKPLDMQVAIGQIHQVAQRQHQEQTLPGVQQQQHAAHLQKDGVRVHETVIETAQDHAGSGVRDALTREDTGRRRKKRTPEKRRDSGPEAGRSEGFARAEEDKGGIVDIRQ